MRPENYPTPNVELLQRTMAEIEEHPEKHDQWNWINSCGTSFCYAGHAALLHGVGLPNDLGVGFWWLVDPENEKSFNGLGHPINERYYRGISVANFAQRKLGLTEIEADVLFDGRRTQASLRKLVDAYCSGAWVDDKGNVWVDDIDQGDVDEWLVPLEQSVAQ